MHPIPFSLPGFAVTEVFPTEERLIICATSQALQAQCPACQQTSSRVHSYYQRSPRDLPISGQAVQLRLRVRRFRCLNFISQVYRLDSPAVIPFQTGSQMALSSEITGWFVRRDATCLAISTSADK